MLDSGCIYSAETATVAVGSYMVLGTKHDHSSTSSSCEKSSPRVIVVLIVLLVPFVSKNLVYPNLSIATVASFLMTTVAVIRS